MLVCMWGGGMWGCGASVLCGEEGCGASVHVGRRDVVLVCMWGGGMWC